MSEEEKNNDYNLEPVVYCSRCYSLKIKHDDTFDEDYCVDCGCTDVCESTIEEWEQLYQNRYGDKFTKKNSDARRLPVYKMSVHDLKLLVSDSSEWRSIIRALYPGFPSNLSKTESVLLFFDKLVTDNRVDELKIVIANKIKK